MSNDHKALHPIKGNDGKPIKPGSPVDAGQIGATRLARLIEKGRVSGLNDQAPVNRAEAHSGRPDLKAQPESKGKADQ